MAQPQSNLALSNPTFRDKIRAWWEGEELALPKPREKRKKKPPIDINIFDPFPFQVELNERLWGAGHHLPWDTSYLGQFVKRIGLQEDKEMLVLGAGLGGCVQELSEFFGVSVLGLEENDDLSALAMERLEGNGGEETARIEKYDPLDLDLPAKKYGAVWINQILFQSGESYPLLKNVEQALASSGHLMILDYVMEEPDKNRAEIDAWAGQEPKTPYLWTIEDYQDNLKNLKFHLLDSYDMTQHYSTKVLKAWSHFEDLVEAAKSSDEDREARYELLLQNADLWAQRAHVIRAGAIKVYAIHAMKPQTGKAMSDW